MQKINQIAILALILAVAMGNRIYPWGEPVLYWPNKGMMTNIQLFFSLNYVLPAGHNLRIRLPFGTNPTYSVTVYQTNTRSIPSTSAIAGTLGLNNPTTFDQYWYFGSDLAAKTNYVLNLQISTAGFPTDSAGWLGFIQLQTLSNANSLNSGSTATDVPIEYDRNLAFAPIHLLAAPNPITWSGTIDSTQISASTTASQSYQLKLSFKLTNDFWYWPTIRLTWSNPAFALTGVVSVDNGTNVTPNPTPLSTSQYSVDYTVPQTITIYHNATILKSYNVIYNVTVQNPNAAASANLGIYVFHRYNLNLTDYATTGVTLSVTNVPNPVVVPVPTVANLTLLLSWGIDPGNSYASPNLLNGVFTIVTSALDPSQRFQAIRFKFDTANIPSGTYTVKAYICASTSNCQVLENSVDSTFGSSAVCGTGSDTTGVYINCTGVSAVASSANIIGARVWISSSLVTTAAINDSVFGSVSVASATVSASTSSINTKIARITQANSLELLANLNGNGPVMADTGSAIWGNFSSCISYSTSQCTASADSLNYGGLYGGIFSYTAGGGAAKFGLLTKIASTIDMTPAPGSVNGSNVYGTSYTGSHTISYDTQDGIDVFLNPNIWTLPSGTVDTTQCWISNQPAAQATASALGNASIHCTSKAVSGVYTRLRSITLAAPTTTMVDTTSASHLYFTYFWGGFVALPAYTGTSLKANSMSEDYYAQLYSVPHASLGLTKPNGNTDIGELGTSGTTNLNVTNVVIGQPLFWSQYRVFSVNIPAAHASVTQQFTGLSVWYAGAVYQGAGTLTSDQVVSLIRVRGALSGSDPISSPPRLALFFNVPTASNAYTLIPPAGTTSATTVGRCWSGSASTSTVCTQDRSARSYSANSISQLEYYQVIATSVSFISSSNTSLAILTREYENQAVLNYRIGFINSNLHYLSGVDATITLNTPVSPTAVGTSGTSSCPISAASNNNVPHVGLTTNSTNIVAQTHDASLHYTSSAQITAASGYGAIIWCGQWQFNGTGFTFSGTSALESSTNGDFCHFFDYNSFADTGINWYCVYCPISVGATTIAVASATAYPSITLKSLTSFWATNVLSPTISEVIDDSGHLLERSQCTTTQSAFTADTATVAISGGSSFNQTGQKVVFSLTVPSTLWNTKNVILDGRTTAGYGSGSSDSSFPRGNFDATAECWLTYSISDPTTWRYFGCPTSSSGALTFVVTSALTGGSATVQAATSWSIVGWGWNGAQDSTGTPVTQYVYITTQASDSSTTIDQGALTSASSLASWNVGVPNQVLSISASNWNRPILGSRGTFSWQFSSTSVRPLYNGYIQNDVLIFHLDAIITSTINSNTGIIQCRITDNSGSTRNQNFQSCSLSTTSTPTLTIVPYPLGAPYEYSASGVQVNLDGMQAINTPSGFNASIYGSLLYAGQSGLASLSASNVVGGINAPSGLNAALPNTLPAPVKVWYGANGNGDIFFTLISAQPLNESCRITIEYPTYYNPELVTRFTTPVCYIDGVITHCQTQRHKLYINSFPVSRAANTQFVIRVSGVSGPVFTTADNFWIQINMDDDEDPSNLVYGGQVVEPANNAGSVTNGIHVNWNSLSSLITRSTATFTWTINPLNSENHNTSRAVHIIFPEWWGLAFGSFVPTCRVADYAVPATIYTATQTIIGHHVLLNLTTTLNATQIVNVICDGIRTPENDGTYPFQDIQLRIVSQDGTTTYQKSAPSVHNINWLAAFTHSTGLSYLNWDSSIVSNPSAPLSLTRGTYSLYWDLVPNASPRDLTVSVSPAAFQFFPSTFEVLYGDLNSYTYVGCAGGVQMLTYSLLFGVNDSTYWTVPAQQWVAVTNTKVNLLVSPSVSTITFEASSNTTSMSLPIAISAYNNLPYSDVTITPTPVGINSNFSVVPSNVQLITAAPWGSFVYMTNGNTQATGASETFTYNLSGTNAASYNMPASQTVTTVADTNSYLPATPVLTVSVDPTQLKPTSASLVYTLTGVDTATVYLGCQLVNSWTVDGNGLIITALTTEFWGLITLDPQQGQYDLIELTSTATPPQSTQSYLMGSLIPSTWYECHAIANSLSNRNSTVAVVYFATPSNGGVRSRWLFNHTTYPNQAQRQALLCTLVQTLAVPVEKIIAVTGEYCSSPNAFYTTDNATGTLAVYFYPLNSNTETVMLPTNLVAQLNTTASFAKLNKTVVAAGGAGINQILADGNPSPTAVSPNFPTSAQTGTNWVSVSPVSLNDTGYVVGVLTTNTTTLAQLAALTFDLTAPVGGNSSVTVGIQQVQVQYYNPTFGSLSFNFSGLTAANGYNVFLIGSNNDPSIFDNVTAATQISATTQSPPVTPTSALALVSSLMVVIISIISVLFV